METEEGKLIAPLLKLLSLLKIISHSLHERSHFE